MLTMTTSTITPSPCTKTKRLSFNLVVMRPTLLEHDLRETGRAEVDPSLLETMPRVLRHNAVPPSDRGQRRLAESLTSLFSSCLSFATCLLLRSLSAAHTSSAPSCSSCRYRQHVYNELHKECRVGRRRRRRRLQRPQRSR